MKQLLKEEITEHIRVIKDLRLVEDSILNFFKDIKTCIDRENKVIFCGNGGSAGDSQHLAAEFTGRFLKERRPLPGLALTTDTSALTSIGNDYGFNEIFSRQIRAIGKRNDILIAISTSGNSANVIECVKAAKDLKIKSIGLLGRGGGDLAKLCDSSIIVPSDITANIQEAHIFIGHALCRFLDDEYS